MSISARRLCIFAIAVVIVLVMLPRCHAEVSAPVRLLSYTKNAIVWQRFGTWLMITEDLPGTGRICYYYDSAHRTRLNLKKAQPGEWVPLGSAIKWLMYVNYVTGRGVLMAHDVDFQVYRSACPSVLSQVGCGMAGTKCIFGQYRADRVGDCRPVDLYCLDVGTGALTPFCISNSEKSQFAHDGGLIVYRARLATGRVGIYGHYFNGTGEFGIAPRDGIEPSVCGSLVAWAEANGAGWKIVAKNLATGQLKTVGYTTANPPRPEAGPGVVLWQTRCVNTGLDIRGYDWAAGREFAVTNAAGDQYGLRVCGDTVTWLTGPVNYQTLWSARVLPPK